MLRKHTLWATITVAALSLASCSKPQTTVTPEPVATAPSSPEPSTIGASGASPASASAGSGSSARDPVTGAVSEEEFKKMHELRSDTPPRRRGTMINLPSARAYLSVPATAQPPVPGIVIIHEWWGLNEHIMHWADRLAADGYAALAVDLFGGSVATTPEEAMKLTKSVDPKRATTTLLEAHEFLKSDARTASPKRAVMGWCFGGKWALNLGLAAPDLNAVVLYYGHVTTDPKELKSLRAPLLGIFANHDKGIPPATVDEFERGLKQVGANFRLLRYDAEHAFANPSAARYDEKAASAAWAEVQKFLKAHL